MIVLESNWDLLSTGRFIDPIYLICKYTTICMLCVFVFVIPIGKRTKNIFIF